MELYLQFGYGMMEHCRSLIAQWGGGTVILSPRDLNDQQLRRLAGEITALPGGDVLLDPQLYIPRSDHGRLQAHEYWPRDYETGIFWQGERLQRLLADLRQLGEDLNCRQFILPGLLADTVDDDWLAIQGNILEEGLSMAGDSPVISTIALSARALQSDDQIEQLIDASTQWHPHGYYLVAEHPVGQYFVSDPSWLVNLMDLASALRMQGAQVIVGYCNQQMLILGCANVNAIASGTWMNVRSFSPARFNAPEPDDVRQRAIWYYCPQAISEYQIPYLDIARRLGVLDLLAPSGSFVNEYSAPLFSGRQPTSVSFSEQSAFRHYFHCIREQAMTAVRPSFNETVAAFEITLNNAASLAARLTESRIVGEAREFGVAVEASRSALYALTQIRGPVLRRVWASLL